MNELKVKMVASNRLGGDQIGDANSLGQWETEME